MTMNETIDEALANLDSARGEITLDFSGVRRIDTAALRSLEALAVAANAKAVKLSLRNVGVSVYKVLKVGSAVPLADLAV